MKISKWKLDEEISSIIIAAQSKNNKNLALNILNLAYGKLEAYDIPYDLKQYYTKLLQEVEQKL